MPTPFQVVRNRVHQLKSDLKFLFSLMFWYSFFVFVDKSIILLRQITNKHNFIDFTYKICNCYIQKVNHAKYLGVVIDKHMSWSEHISQIIKKANSAKAFLQRNFNCCPIPVKAKLYATLVRPILEFCCTVWSPHTISDIQSLEKVQRNAARYVCGDYSRFHSVTAMLDKLQWPTLKDRRHHLITAMMYK